MSNDDAKVNDQAAGSWLDLSHEQKGLDSLNIPSPEPIALADGITGHASLDTSGIDTSPAGNPIDYDG